MSRLTALTTMTLSSTMSHTSSSRTTTSILTSDASFCSTSTPVSTTTYGPSTNSRSSTAHVMIFTIYRPVRSLTKLPSSGLSRRPRFTTTLSLKAYSECHSTMCLTAITSSLVQTLQVNTTARTQRVTIMGSQLVTPEKWWKLDTSSRLVA